MARARVRSCLYMSVSDGTKRVQIGDVFVFRCMWSQKPIILKSVKRRQQLMKTLNYIEKFRVLRARMIDQVYLSAQTKIIQVQKTSLEDHVSNFGMICIIFSVLDGVSAFISPQKIVEVMKPNFWFPIPLFFPVNMQTWLFVDISEVLTGKC